MAENIEYVGITENCDPSYHLDIFDNLYKANIIITKRLCSDELVEKIIEHKDCIILHVTCTGFGGSALEPRSPKKEVVHEYFKKLINGGFPVKQAVLRIDPCVPTDRGIETAKSVVELFSDTGIKRVRFSSMDMYQHVKDRFRENGVPLPYKTFHAPDEMILKLYESLKSVTDKYGMELETCAEPIVDSISCLSQKDIDILGLTNEIKLVGSAKQRKNCHCPANKKSILKTTSVGRCDNQCLYCFWKGELPLN